MKVRFLSTFLTINDCKVILFPFSIRGMVQLDQLVIILILDLFGQEEKGGEKLPKNNIYAFNEKAEQVWQIQEPLQDVDSCKISYAELSLRKDNRVIVATTKGVKYIVDINDGSVEPIKIGSM